MADEARLEYEFSEKPKPAWLQKKMPFNGYTFKDFMAWDDDIRVELIDGIPYMMAPPLIWHQDTAGSLFRQIANFLEDKPCKVFIAPTGVRLFPKDDGTDGTVVLPDILVVCDEEKLADGKTVNGAPDFILEVLSPGNRGHDLMTKKDLYELAGVKEYWVVGQDKLYKYLLAGGKYHEAIIELSKGLNVEINILQGCVLAF